MQNKKVVLGPQFSREKTADIVFSGDIHISLPDKGLAYVDGQGNPSRGTLSDAADEFLTMSDEDMVKFLVSVQLTQNLRYEDGELLPGWKWSAKGEVIPLNCPDEPS